jgi:HEAT repeat protein
MSSGLVAAQVNQALVSALTGQPAVFNMRPSDLISSVDAVAPAIAAVMHRPGITLAQQFRVNRALHRAGIDAAILDALAGDDPRTRAAAAKLCGALRLADAVPWLADLLADDDERVRVSAAVALGRTGGRRAVEALIAAAERFHPHELAVNLARAASDIDLDGLLRQTDASAAAAVAVALACGLRADALRFPPLGAIARDPRADPALRAAACRALGMIGDRAAAGVLRNLTYDHNSLVSSAAKRGLRRYHPGLPRP